MKGQSTEDRGTAERLTEAFQEREQRIAEVVGQLEESEEKRRAAQATLDAAYKYDTFAVCLLSHRSRCNKSFAFSVKA